MKSVCSSSLVHYFALCHLVFSRDTGGGMWSACLRGVDDSTVIDIIDALCILIFLRAFSAMLSLEVPKVIKKICMKQFL